MTVAELQWGSFEYISMQQDHKFTMTSFVAALGGATGMWLGLSMLSLIQFSTYAAAYVRQSLLKKSARKRRISVAPSPPKSAEATAAATAANVDAKLGAMEEGKVRKASNAVDGDIASLDGFAANPFLSPFKAKVRRHERRQM